MDGFVTYCFSDWQSEQFQRGVMQIRNGRRIDSPIRRPLRADEVENRDYYIKPDPNFEMGTYSICHRKLRQIVRVGDVLFFRTLWRGGQYLIGYFTIGDKKGEKDNPTLIADLANSQLIHFACPITLNLARQINPGTNFHDGVHPNASINGRLGRNYKRIDEHTTRMLMTLMQKRQLRAATA